jgi:hypothetical protein
MTGGEGKKSGEWLRYRGAGHRPRAARAPRQGTLHPRRGSTHPAGTPVTVAIAFGTDGKLIVTACDDGVARVGPNIGMALGARDWLP